MKKSFFLFICLLTIVGCKQKQTGATQEGAPADSIVTSDNAGTDDGFVSPAALSQQWQAKPIKVEKGGAKPDILSLLRAFHKTWSTAAVSALLGHAEDPNFSTYYNYDTGGGVILNRNNGYAAVAAGDTDDDTMEAAVWKRTNGHRLFMLYTFTPAEDLGAIPAQQAVCCYDYDPKTETLTPEQNIVTQFKPKQGQYAIYSLPKEGTTLSIQDCDKNLEGTYHIFTWNGQQFAEANAYTEKEFTSQINGTWMCKDENKPALTFNITDDDEHFWEVSDCGIYGSTEFDAFGNFQNGFLTIAEKQPEDNGGEENTNKSVPAISSYFWLTKDGLLKGTYIIRQNGGKVSKGEITLEKESQLNQYAE
ncbi:MAG: hypothetical protein K5764_07100 [Prevotella sp.]|nr:hypothetical protein [Prevotella sp.]